MTTCPICARPTRPVHAAGNRRMCTALPGVCRWTGVGAVVPVLPVSNPVGNHRYHMMMAHDRGQQHPADQHSHADQERRRGEREDVAPEPGPMCAMTRPKRCGKWSDDGRQRCVHEEHHFGEHHYREGERNFAPARAALTCEFPDCSATHPALLEGDEGGEGWRCSKLHHQDICRAEEPGGNQVKGCNRASGHSGDHMCWTKDEARRVRWPQQPAAEPSHDEVVAEARRRAERIGAEHPGSFIVEDHIECAYVNLYNGGVPVTTRVYHEDVRADMMAERGRK